MGTKSWIWDSDKKALVPKEQYVRKSSKTPTIFASPKPFISPVSGELITDRKQLRDHNKRHEVTDIRDYGDGYFERKGKEKYEDQQGTSAAAKRDRRDLIQRAIYRANENGRRK